MLQHEGAQMVRHRMILGQSKQCVHLSRQNLQEALAIRASDSEIDDIERRNLSARNAKWGPKAVRAVIVKRGNRNFDKENLAGLSSL